MFVCVILSVFVGCGQQPPLQITIRDSLATAFIGKHSSVLIFTNLSDKHLSVTLNAIARDGKDKRSWTFDLLPHERNIEIGILETGWAFESGETIEINVPGYGTRTEKIP
ncbi:MAG: hypothetical protein LBE18_09335 [Planctomycetaceae bacterium]|nr:hypothetical protein [Planctomycetaceae bacterium]